MAMSMGTDQHNDQFNINKDIASLHPQSGTYSHGDQAVQRPAVEVQQEFPDWRRPKEYRYDSSLAPELCWDEHAERDQAEWLLDRRECHRVLQSTSIA